MKTHMNRVPVFRAIAGIAAATAIVFLLVEEDFDAFEPATIANALAALLVLASVLVPTPPAGGPFSMPRGEVLRLESFGLTRREREYALDYIAGKQIKEIACDRGVGASTVRTALSLAYKKLGISSGAELRVLGAYYHVE
jgi:DNA-binding CsgD family transcriptional regulator